MRAGIHQQKIIGVALCVPLFAATHLANAWLFDHISLSNHISWVYLPAFLRVAYVLILGPVWGFAAIFFGSSLSGVNFDENLLQALFNAGASGLGPVLALGLFRLLKERKLQLSRPSDLIQMCLLYALLNAVIHHFSWAYQQPDQLMSVTQLPIMILGDLTGALLGAFLFTLLIRRLGLYQALERLSKETNPSSPP
jgi:hypothetical protein